MNYISHLRKKANISQQALAKAAGWNQPRLANYEKSLRVPSLALMNPLMILVKIIKLRWIHILSYDQMVSRKINNQTTRCANSIFYTTLFTNSAPNYT
ncbi:helix-turn-helix domain-containing protein [Klebsiella pneumoniae]|uniref:helix-turn-helix domain-containing protein n=1 Tax=Klebsiella pneumoniae TaxID=573 RepID=UPI000940BD96|nr:helix-turn-helix transcriptional regulator [Klebsiella pneumoniae]